MQAWGSMIVQAIPAIGLLAAGRYQRIGWLICLMGQVVAVGFGLLTGLWGYWVMAPAYVLIYGYNWIRWSKREGKENDKPGSVCDLRHRRDDCVDAQ